LDIRHLFASALVAFAATGCTDSKPTSTASPSNSTPNSIKAEPPFTLACSGKSGNKNSDGLEGEFSFRITINSERERFWIHNTKWNWSYWKPLIAADNEIRKLPAMDEEKIYLGVAGVVINRSTGKVGDGDQMSGTCVPTEFKAIPDKQF
jgi:hypothetical protein